MDWVAQNGRLGRVVTVPAGFTPGTDVATLALFGYDPHTYYSGRAPIEAAARGLTVGPDELVFRCNFVTILDGRMRDFTAGHIAQAEADRLIAELNTLVRGRARLAGVCVPCGRVVPQPPDCVRGAEMQLTCAPPHDIPNQPVADHLPRGRGESGCRPSWSGGASCCGTMRSTGPARAGPGARHRHLALGPGTAEGAYAVRERSAFTGRSSPAWTFSAVWP